MSARHLHTSGKGCQLSLRHDLQRLEIKLAEHHLRSSGASLSLSASFATLVITSCERSAASSTSY